MLTKQKINQINSVLKRHPVIFNYVFGSSAKSNTWGFSDLDLAVYLESGLDKIKIKQIISEIRDELEKQLNMPEKIDFVCLNDELPFLLLKEIVYEGQLIYSKDEEKRISWESKAISLWLDWAYYQQQFDQAILNQPRI